MQCSAVQCSTVQCSAVQYSAVQCSAVQCSAVQCSAVQCSAVQCSTVQYSAVQCTREYPWWSGHWVRTNDHLMAPPFSQLPLETAGKLAGKCSAECYLRVHILATVKWLLWHKQVKDIFFWWHLSWALLTVACIMPSIMGFAWHLYYICFDLSNPNKSMCKIIFSFHWFGPTGLIHKVIES